MKSASASASVLSASRETDTTRQRQRQRPRHHHHRRVIVTVIVKSQNNPLRRFYARTYLEEKSATQRPAGLPLTWHYALSGDSFRSFS